MLLQWMILISVFYNEKGFMQLFLLLHVYLEDAVDDHYH